MIKKSVYFVLMIAVLSMIAGTIPMEPVLPIDTIGAGYAVGDIADDFNLKGTSDKNVSMEDYTEAKGFIITFTCNTCPFAVMYEDRLIELHNKMAPLGYPVIAINPNDPDVKPGDSFSEMKKRHSYKNFPFNYLFDEGQQVYPKFGATKTPHVYVLDNNRKVRYIGAIDNSVRDASLVSERYVENAIMAIEGGNEPDPTFTKAIGCSIKTKS